MNTTNSDIGEMPADADLSWYSYYHQRATLPPPIGSRVIYSVIDGIDLRRLYEVTGYDDMADPHFVVLRDMQTMETVTKVGLREIAPALRQYTATIETLLDNKHCTPLIRVRDGKAFLPAYFNTSFKSKGDLVLISVPDETDTEMDIVSSDKLTMGQFATLYIPTTSVPDVDRAYREHQLALIALHDGRIKAKVARDQQLAADWVASMV